MAAAQSTRSRRRTTPRVWMLRVIVLVIGGVATVLAANARMPATQTEDAVATPPEPQAEGAMALVAALLGRMAAWQAAPEGPSRSTGGSREHGCGRCPDSNGRPAMAIILAGTRQRFLVNGTLRHLIRPLSTRGYEVHLYVDLVNLSAHGNAFFNKIREDSVEDPQFSGLSGADFSCKLRAIVAASGGCVKALQLPSGPYVLPPLPCDDEAFQRQLWLFNPCQKNPGKAAVRRYRAMESLWLAAKEHERAAGMRYNGVIWTRDDALWFGDIGEVEGFMSPQSLAGAHSSTVWTKGCQERLNDKIGLMGRQAADVMLRAYTEFLGPTFHHPTKSTEQYLLSIARRANLSTPRLRWSQVPTADGMLTVRGPCLVHWYYCTCGPSEPPLPFCESLSSNKAVRRKWLEKGRRCRQANDSHFSFRP